MLSTDLDHFISFFSVKTIEFHPERSDRLTMCLFYCPRLAGYSDESNIFPVLFTWSLILRSVSIVRLHKAGNILTAQSFKLKNSTQARKPITPAERAGGKGSRKARKNAGINTFWRVCKKKGDPVSIVHFWLINYVSLLYLGLFNKSQLNKQGPKHSEINSNIMLGLNGI